MDTTRRSNQDTPARWAKALERATAQGVIVRQLAASGAWIATSGTDSEAAYLVTADTCECRAAAEGDPCCKHRAALRQRLGLLEPVVIVGETIPAQPEPICQNCNGDRYVRMYVGGGLNDYWAVPCRACEATKAAA